MSLQYVINIERETCSLNYLKQVKCLKGGCGSGSLVFGRKTCASVTDKCC